MTHTSLDQLAAATPFARAADIGNQDRGWTIPGFAINRNTLMLRGEACSQALPSAVASVLP